MIFYKYIDWMRVLELSFKLLNGDFIKNETSRLVWRMVIYGSLIVALFVYVINPIMDWWQGVVDYINYVRWGIE